MCLLQFYGEYNEENLLKRYEVPDQKLNDE